MDTSIYDRIKALCERKGITVAKLERDLGFGSNSIGKWGKSGVSPSIDKIAKIATYFKVSADYLLGLSDISQSADEVLADADVISFQRARQNMTEEDRKKSMSALHLLFDYAFDDQGDG